MSSTYLERCRVLHAEIEHLKAALVEDLKTDCKGHSKVLAQDHRVAGRIKKIRKNTRELLQIYKDADNRRAEELKEMAGRSCLQTFKDRVKDLNKYHRKQQIANEHIATEEKDVEVSVDWAGDEMGGRFLDLHELHKDYLNMPHFKDKNGEKIDYMMFLDRLFNFRRVRKQNKDKRYLDFYTKVLDYLVSFWDRTRPLTPSTKIISKIMEQFDFEWEAKELPGWFKPWKASKMNMHFGGDDDIEDEEDELVGNPLYDPVSRKLFTNFNTFEHFKKGKKYKRLLARVRCTDKWSRDIAATEKKIQVFAELLKGNLEATKEYIEKKQTRTYKEIQDALIEAERESDEELSEEEDMFKDTEIYNPLNIPLDFDGKPIPYWLYKFRGLNRTFTCEICGDFEYRGPRAFQRHFREWRHAHGMRCLGIPNTKDFHLITKINDAIALHDKIKKTKQQSAYRPDEEEEFEDINGTVFRKRDYDRLVRQGVL